MSSSYPVLIRYTLTDWELLLLLRVTLRSFTLELAHLILLCLFRASVGNFAHHPPGTYFNSH